MDHADKAVAVEDQQSAAIEWLPSRFQDFARLARLDRPIGTWLLLLPCWWGVALASGELRLDLAALFAIGAIAMRGAGCTINDLVDRDYDARVERTRNRPIASRRVSVFEALLFLLGQLLVGLIVLLMLPRAAQLVALASVPLIVVYPFMKRITYWPQLFLGITFNWGILVGVAATEGGVTWAAVVLYIAGIAWTLGYDTIYAHQDKDDDLLVGVKSSAIRLGEQTKTMLVVFYGTASLLAGLTMHLQGASALALIALLPVAAHFVWQVRTLDIDDRVNCLARFRSNRTAGFLILLALCAGRYAG